MTNNIKRVGSSGIKTGLLLNEAFRRVQNGGIVNVEVGKNAYVKEEYNGLMRVTASQAKSGRPQITEEWPEFPMGSMTLTLEALDKSGRVLKLNWRRDQDIIKQFSLQMTANKAGVVGVANDSGIRTTTITYIK